MQMCRHACTPALTKRGVTDDRLKIWQAEEESMFATESAVRAMDVSSWMTTRYRCEETVPTGHGEDVLSATHRLVVLCCYQSTLNIDDAWLKVQRLLLGPANIPQMCSRSVGGIHSTMKNAPDNQMT